MRSLIVSMFCAAAMMLSGCALSGPGACNNGCGGGMLLSAGGGGCGGGDSCGCQSPAPAQSCNSSCGNECQGCGGGGMPCGFESLGGMMGSSGTSSRCGGSCGDTGCGGGCGTTSMQGAYASNQGAGCNTGCAPNTRLPLPPIGAGFQSLGLGRPQGASMGLGCGKFGCGMSGKLCGGCGIKSRLAGVRGKFSNFSDQGSTYESAPMDSGCGSGSCGGGLGHGAIAGGGLGHGTGGFGSGVLDNLSAKATAALAHEPHPYAGAIPHTVPMQGPGPGIGGGAPTYRYPYYTTRGPRDFLNPNPPSIGY